MTVFISQVNFDKLTPLLVAWCTVAFKIIELFITIIASFNFIFYFKIKDVYTQDRNFRSVKVTSLRYVLKRSVRFVCANAAHKTLTRTYYR